MRSNSHDELIAARGRVAAHRESLRENLGMLRNRVSPRELRRDVSIKLRRAGNDVTTAATDTVRQHPVAVGVGAVAIVGYLLRRPITRISPPTARWIGERYQALRDHLSSERSASNDAPHWWNRLDPRRLFHRSD